MSHGPVINRSTFLFPYCMAVSNTIIINWVVHDFSVPLVWKYCTQGLQTLTKLDLSYSKVVHATRGRII